MIEEEREEIEGKGKSGGKKGLKEMTPIIWWLKIIPIIEFYLILQKNMMKSDQYRYYHEIIFYGDNESTIRQT